MTIPIIVLLVVLVVLFGVLFVGAVTMAVVGTMAVLKDDAGVGLLLIGTLIAFAVAACIAGVAYHSDGPACRLAPSSLVEREP